MASFKNIRNTASENATYAAYKKLTAQDAVVSWYISKKQFNVEGADLTNNGVYSLIFDREIDLSLPAPSSTPTPTLTGTPSVTPSKTPSNTPSKTPSTTPSTTPQSTPSATPSITPTRTVTLSVTPSVTPSITPTRTVTPSVTPSITPTRTVTPSITPTNTVTPTPSTSVAVGTFNINPNYGMSVTNVTAVDGTPPQSANIPNFIFPVTLNVDSDMIDSYLVPVTFSVTVGNYPGSGTYKIDIVHYPSDPLQAGYSQSTIGTVNFSANGTYNITCTNPSFISINDDISIQINL